ncbi:hypothetical protein BGZ65_012121 [Modicella reniformis]|uniref:Ribosome maturation protein SDO1/SBDS N-terminal domain-containing protein n=1 Tax=Modicella reniformis TaxID=1440133 RepID=A0A9P6IJQ5_9FUNG|nr:hypothetical protein BGZ65_012121 [Modicella reniformis]
MEKIVYKAYNSPSQHRPDVFILAEPGMALKYRAQKKSTKDESPLALVDVVQSFDIFQSETGKGFEGKTVRPAKGDLHSLFLTENNEEIVEKIVLEGEIQGAQV